MTRLGRPEESNVGTPQNGVFTAAVEMATPWKERLLALVGGGGERCHPQGLRRGDWLGPTLTNC